MIEALELTSNWIQYFLAIAGAATMWLMFMMVVFVAIKRAIP